MHVQIKKPPQPSSPLRQVMLGLCLLLIVLQAADGLSTHLAIATGKAEEQNELLLALAHMLGWSVIDTVFAAKIVTSAIFGVAMLKTKATPMLVVILALLAVYVGYIVAMNFYWAWHLG